MLRPYLAASSAVLAALSAYVVISPAASADTPTIAAQAADIQISEVESNGGSPDDWIELHNLNTTTAEDLAGWWLQDNDSGDHYDIAAAHSPAGTVIPAGGYLAFDVSWDYDLTPPAKGASPQNFGLGGADSARLYDAQNNLVDHVDWSQHADDPITGGGKATPDATYTRCTGSYDESGWIVTDTDSKGAANGNCPSPATVDTYLQTYLHVNEVMAANVTDASNVQLPDWIELTNTGPVAQDISGWILSDDKPADADYLPSGTVIAPGDHLSHAVGVTAGTPYAAQDPFLSTTYPGKTNVDFGLGAGGDNAALVFPNGQNDVDRVIWGSDNTTKPPGNTSSVPSAGTGKTMGRCPDGTGAWAVTYTPSENAANACANPADAQIKLNEIDTATSTVELKNISGTSADVSAWILKNAAGQTFTIPSSTTIPAGAYATFHVSGALTFDATGDSATLLDGIMTVDSTSWDHALSTSWGRCADGSGPFTDTAAATDGAANSCPVVTPPTTGYDSIRINEIETNGDVNGDWIELANVGTSDVNISKMILADDGGDGGTDTGTVSGHSWPIPGTTTDPADTTTPGNTVLPAGGYKVFYTNTDFIFGLGGPDMARIFTPTHQLVDSTAWVSHESGVTYERCPGAAAGSTVFTDSFGDAFVNSWSNSPGAANDCLPPIRINEVQASDTTGGPDWVELTNVGNQPVDISNYVLTDDTDTGHQYVIGNAVGDTATLAPGAFAAYDVDNTAHAGSFGLGKKGDEVRLYQPGAFTAGGYDNNALVDSFVFEDTSGLTDADARLPQTVTLPGGTWPVNADEPTSSMTYARCSDGTSRIVADGSGQWAPTSTQTKGAGNRCDGLLTTTPWPDTHNGQAVTTADSVDVGQNMSGLFYVAGVTPADDYMWGIQNGSSGLSGANPGDPGSLYKLVKGPDGGWGPAAGWDKGVPVRYQDGQGEPDSEGVTAVGGKVYVATERDNTDDAVSKIAVLQVDPAAVAPRSGDADGDLVATHEWDLGPVLGPNGTAHTGLDASNPGDANLGIEGVAFVPDAYLAANDFVDQSTGHKYAPADYPNNVADGVFFVAMEKTGKLYGFVLNSDNTFTLVTTVDTGFPTVMDVMWDPAQQALWATCDNSCQGRSSLIRIDADGTFQPVTVNERPTGATQNLNNEGFTVAPASECVNGTKPAFWADDTDDGQHWLRAASVDCTTPASNQVAAVINVVVSGTPSASGWFSAPLTVSFTCRNVDAVLNQPCPAPVTITSTTPQHVLTTLTDTLGGTYPVIVPSMQIDQTPPAVRIVGVQNGATYIGWGPQASCEATDSLSGVASCTLAIVRTPTAVRITATAKDHAGNSATATVSYRTVPFYLEDAAYEDGTFKVVSGRTYTVAALTTSNMPPRLLGPVPAGRKFGGSGRPFAAGRAVGDLHLFTARLKITIRSGTWELGVKVGTEVHVITLHQ